MSIEPSSAATGISQRDSVDDHSAASGNPSLIKAFVLGSPRRLALCVCGVAGDLAHRSPVGDTCRRLSFSEGNDFG
jgi:hypothetical protein